MKKWMILSILLTVALAGCVGQGSDGEILTDVGGIDVVATADSDEDIDALIDQLIEERFENYANLLDQFTKNICEASTTESGEFRLVGSIEDMDGDEYYIVTQAGKSMENPICSINCTLVNTEIYIGEFGDGTDVNVKITDGKCSIVDGYEVL